jgi:hypothetical protein
MGRRKIFIKTDLTTAQVEHERDADGRVVIPSGVIPPANTAVNFGRNPLKARRFDFAPWYGIGIDPITYACQRQVERFLDKQDCDVEVATVVGYCREGLTNFFKYLVVLSAALRRPLTLADTTRDTVDGYLLFLRDKGIAVASQRTAYSYTKAVLQALGRRGLITVIDRGDSATFPRNPFPNLQRDNTGQRPLSSTERKAFTVAVKTAVRPLFTEDAEPSGTLLAYALLVVALHTGRNATPLLEMPTACLRAHPKDSTEFLVLYKRRGYTSSKVALRIRSSVERVVESTPTLRPTVAHLIRRVVALTASAREEALDDIKGRVWLYRSRRTDTRGQITALTFGTLAEAVSKLVRSHRLTDDDGKPMRVNVSRLRKTFVNRVHEILDGDIAATAIAAGNSPATTMRHYLRPGENARRNWRFMGEVLVEELLTRSVGATERTPVGRCSDTHAGEYAPKRDGTVCQSFLNCLRCRNYVVTGDDLWRLYSFYWRVLRERPHMDKHRWERHLAHIPRLIERDVIDAGLARKMFKPAQVQAARERARHDPHPFWASPTIINQLSSLT